MNVGQVRAPPSAQDPDQKYWHYGNQEHQKPCHHANSEHADARPGQRPECDTLGRETSETAPEGTTSRTWDEFGNELTTTAPGNLVTTRTFDLANRVTHEVAPLQTTDTTYDAAGNALSVTVAGDTTSRTYDGLGRLVAETIDPGASPHLALTTEHAYDAAGNETATRNSDLTVTRSVYDAQGRVTRSVENCTSTGTTVWILGDTGWKACTGAGTHDATWNSTTTFGYDDRGNKVTETAPNGRATSWSFDDLDRVTRVVDIGTRPRRGLDA